MKEKARLTDVFSGFNVNLHYLPMVDYRVSITCLKSGFSLFPMSKTAINSSTVLGNQQFQKISCPKDLVYSSSERKRESPGSDSEADLHG